MAEGIGKDQDVRPRIVGQIFLGSEQWIQQMRARIEAAQRCSSARPALCGPAADAHDLRGRCGDLWHNAGAGPEARCESSSTRRRMVGLLRRTADAACDRGRAASRQLGTRLGSDLDLRPRARSRRVAAEEDRSLLRAPPRLASSATDHAHRVARSAPLGRLRRRCACSVRLQRRLDSSSLDLSGSPIAPSWSVDDIEGAPRPCLEKCFGLFGDPPDEHGRPALRVRCGDVSLRADSAEGVVVIP